MLLFFLATSIYTQNLLVDNGATKDMDEEELFQYYTQSNYYDIDRNHVIVKTIIEDLGIDKDEIYDRVKMYLSRSDKNANWTILHDNPEDGLVVAKGIYATIGSHGYGVWNHKVDYTIRVDFMDQRARLVCAVDKVIINNTVDESVPEKIYDIVDYIPLGEKKVTYNSKKQQYEGFNTLVEGMNSTLHRLSQTLTNGSYLQSEAAIW